MHNHSINNSSGLTEDLQGAIERGEFFLNYQPIVSLKSRQIVSFESKMLRNHPERGVMFIPCLSLVATTPDQLALINQWLLQQACSQLQVWHQKFPRYAALTISVNLAELQLTQTPLIDHVIATLELTGLEPQFLNLEIDERSLLKNFRHSLAVLERLVGQINIQVTIDHFGTGYSSFKHLVGLPCQTLKFIYWLPQKGKNAGCHCSSWLLEPIIHLANVLSMQVIADGLETREQVTQLLTLGCNYAQGNFFSKPLSALHVEDLLNCAQPF